MRVQVQGPQAAAVAAQLRQHFDAVGLSHETLKEPPLVMRDAGTIISIIGLLIALPGSAKAMLDMRSMLSQQAQIDQLKAQVEALRAQYPHTEVIPVRDDGEAWSWK